MTTRPITAAQLRGLTAEQGAALWLVKRRGDGIVGDAELFQRWLDESEEHRSAWRRAEALWAVFDEPESERLGALRGEALKMTAALRSPVWRGYAIAALAAALVLVVLVGILRIAPPDRPGVDASQIASKVQAPRTFATEPGRRSTVTLADGTKVTLDGSSVLRVAFAPTHRHVALDRGHAYFDVAHDAARPFDVSARFRTITVLGTRFDVRLDDAAMRVALLEGRVRVASRDRAASIPVTILAPGEQLVARSGARDVVSRFDGETVSAWRSETIAFEDIKLSEAVAVLNAGGAIKVTVNPVVADLRVGGHFRRGDLKRFGRTISLILPVKFVWQGSQEVRVEPR